MDPPRPSRAPMFGGGQQSHHSGWQKLLEEDLGRPTTGDGQSAGRERKRVLDLSGCDVSGGRNQGSNGGGHGRVLQKHMSDLEDLRLECAQQNVEFVGQEDPASSKDRRRSTLADSRGDTT